MSKIMWTQNLGVPRWRSISCATIGPESCLGEILWWQVLGCATGTHQTFRSAYMPTQMWKYATKSEEKYCPRCKICERRIKSNAKFGHCNVCLWEKRFFDFHASCMKLMLCMEYILIMIHMTLYCWSSNGVTKFQIEVIHSEKKILF